MSRKANAILMLCLWGFLTTGKYYELFVDKTFAPDFFEWFLLIGGPLVIIFEIWQLHQAIKER